MIYVRFVSGILSISSGGITKIIDKISNVTPIIIGIIFALTMFVGAFGSGFLCHSISSVGTK